MSTPNPLTNLQSLLESGVCEAAGQKQIRQVGLLQKDCGLRECTCPESS